MSKETKNKVVPKLRFPEFCNRGEWEEKQLRNIGEIITGKTPNTKDNSLWNGDVLFITPTDIKESDKYQLKTERTIAEQKDTRTLPIGTVIYTCIASIGKIAITTKVSITNQQINSIVVNDEINNEFIYYGLINLTPHIKSRPATSTLPIINKSEFSEFTIKIPKPDEQQKIADCLSSLDDYLAAQGQKLDALKAHKKGLMQQLFPTEGETVPKLRFKEFRDSGEWEEKNILDLAKDGFSNGVFNDPKKVGSGYKLINVSDMYLEGTINENRLTLIDIPELEFLKNKVEYGDIFFTRSSLVAAGIAHSNIYLGISNDITFDGHLIKLTPNRAITNPIFLHYLLKTEIVRSQLIARGKTATMTTIGQSDIASTKLMLPLLPIEQKKIADCLSSLDDLIAAQAEKIEALKKHTQGLMQGLFPVVQDKTNTN